MREDNKILKLIYTFFLGLLLAIFVGVGISTFYTAPPSPEYPEELTTLLGKEPNNEELAAEKAYQKQMEEYEETMKPYHRNVSIIALGFSVALLAISFLLEKKKVPVLSDGFMLGGLFTLLYSLGRSFAAENSKYSFAMVSLSLVFVLFLGYHRFVRSRKLSPENK